MVVPPTFFEYTSRRVLTTGWLSGEKLSQSTANDVGSLVNIGVICYLKQLLDTGLFHADEYLLLASRLDCIICCVFSTLEFQLAWGDKDDVLAASWTHSSIQGCKAGIQCFIHTDGQVSQPERPSICSAVMAML